MLASMQVAAVLIDFRWLFGGIVVMLSAILLGAIFSRSARNGLSFSATLISSLALLVVAILAMITENKMLTLTQMTGDRLTFYLFLASVLLAIINPIVHKWLHKGSSRRRYHF